MVTLPTLQDLDALPMVLRMTVQEQHLDAMGHMNIRHYLGTFDEGAWEMFKSFGLHLEYYRAHQAGMFALEQHIRYVKEVRLGEVVQVRFRLLAHNAKRAHFMMFMVNETHSALSAIFESLGSHADLTVRRTSPFPPHIQAQLESVYQAHVALPWDAPVGGAISV